MEEEEEVNVKIEKVIVSEEVEWKKKKNEDCIYSEEEKKENEDIGTQNEDGVEVKEEVSWEDTF
jgi:hypothetical protein